MQGAEPRVAERDRRPAEQPPPPTASFVPFAPPRTKSPRPRTASAAPTRQRRTPAHPFPLIRPPCPVLLTISRPAVRHDPPTAASPPGSARTLAGSGRRALARRQSQICGGRGASAPPRPGAGCSYTANGRLRWDDGAGRDGGGGITRVGGGARCVGLG